jgi:hypothetical protein
MATQDKISCLHTESFAMSFGGATAAVLGTVSFLMVHKHTNGSASGDRSMQIIKVAAILLYVSGIIALGLAMGLFYDGKEHQAEDITTMIHQARKKNSQPDVPEPLILASVSTVVVLISAVHMVRAMVMTGEFSLVGLAGYSVGWLGNAFAASTHDKSLSSIHGTRLAMSLPGAIAIVAGTMLIPSEIRNHQSHGFSIPLSILGYFLVAGGHAAVLHPVEISVE